MKVKGIKKVAAIMLSLLLVGMFMPVIYVKANGDIPIDEEHFPDANFRNYILSQNYGTDGVLTSAEIAGVTEMDCRNKSISNLTGIEYFTALTILRCTSNKLKSIDVSKNTALKELYCSSNKLKSLDVSKNLALTYLFCTINQLTSLDVSKNLALEKLRFASNQLTSLDVSNNTALKDLSCSSNQLTSLDVSKNIALEELGCTSNPLTSLKVPFEGGTITATVSNGGLGTFECTEISFLYKTLTIDDPTLDDDACTFMGWSVTGATSSDVEGGTKFTVGSGNSTIKASWEVPINESNFPDTNFRNYILSQSYGADGKLTSDEIATATEINCQFKDIYSLKGIEYFSSLTTLYCSNNNLSSLDVSKNTALTKLYCPFNQLTSLDVSKNTNLTHLKFSNNRLTSIDVSDNTSLVVLSCSSNQLTSLDVSKNTALKHLECNSNQLTSLDVSSNIALEYIGCFTNPLTFLKVPFGSASTVTVSNGGLGTFNCFEIDFEHNTLTIADPTYPGYTFTGWSVTGANPTDVEGGTKFTVGDTDATMTAVWEVPINATNFPDDNFRNYILSQTYGTDGKLTLDEIAGEFFMDLSNQSISNLKGIEYFTALSTLDCSNNNLTSLDVSSNTALETLNCNDNQFTSLDVSSNTYLQSLHCYKNQLTSLDVSNSTSLGYLNCYDNPLTSLIVPFGSASTVTVSNGGHGTINCLEIDFSAKKMIIDTPSPTPAYTFKDWSVTGDVTTAPEVANTTFTVNSTTATITAEWNHKPILTIKEIYQDANGREERTVTTTEIANKGEIKTVTKTAPSGYTIVGESTQTVTMDSDKTITFTYRKKSSGGGYVPQRFKVTYTDGVEDIVFEDETYYVSAGGKTPDFKGKTEREGYTFKGWSPEVTKTVTRSVTYTAIWEENDPKKPDPDDPDPLMPVPVKIYRLYNPGGYHFFTSDINERDYLIPLGWYDEGTGFISTDEAMIPVYRVYNPNNGDHFFTVDLDEVELLVSLGWSSEGIGFYGFEEGVPVYRLYNPNSGGEHFYTMDIAERDALIGLGWCDEGIAFYMTVSL